MGLTLLGKLIEGDKKISKDFIIKSSEYIYKLAFIHTKYEEDARIITERVLIYIYNNIHTLSKYDSFEKYMIKVTINYINEYLEEMGIVEQNNNDDYIDKDGNIEMFKGIDLLDIHLKNVVILIYFYNMSYEEVGDILNMDVNTVKLYIRNSLKFMKDNIKGGSRHNEGKVR